MNHRSTTTDKYADDHGTAVATARIHHKAPAARLSTRHRQAQAPSSFTARHGRKHRVAAIDDEEEEEEEDDDGDSWQRALVVMVLEDDNACMMTVVDASTGKSDLRTVPLSDMRVGRKPFVVGSFVDAILRAGDEVWSPSWVTRVSGSTLELVGMETGETCTVANLRVRTVSSYEVGDEVDYLVDGVWTTGFVAAVADGLMFDVKHGGGSGRGGGGYRGGGGRY